MYNSNSDQNVNPLSLMHTDASGMETPIVSMGADHLVATVNFYLNKQPQRTLNALRAKISGNYAPLDMDVKTARVLGLRCPTPEEAEMLEKRIEQASNELYEKSFLQAVPYIFVGLVRDDTCEGVRAIVQEYTGIVEAVVIPQYVEDNPIDLLPPPAGEGVPEEWIGDYDDDIIDQE